jgi:hypothetical protein
MLQGEFLCSPCACNLTRSQVLLADGGGSYHEEQNLGWVHTKRGTLEITVPRACFARAKDLRLQVHSNLAHAQDLTRDDDATPAVLNGRVFTADSATVRISGGDANPWHRSSKKRQKPRILFQLVAVQPGTERIVGRSIPFCLYRDKLPDEFKQQCVAALQQVNVPPVEAAPVVAEGESLADRISQCWETVRGGLPAVECEHDWERDMCAIWAAQLGEWGSYASWTHWWVECRDDSHQKAMVVQQLTKTHDDVKERLVVYALPFFHLRHQRIVWLCFTQCDEAKALLRSVKEKPSSVTKSLYLLRTDHLIGFHRDGRIVLKLPAQDESIPTF